MTHLRRTITILLLGAITSVFAAAPAAAHGVGGRTDLPLPAWQLAWAAGFAVASSFVALGAFWSRPKLEAAAVRGRVVLDLVSSPARVLTIALKLVGLFLFGVVMYAAWAGNTNPVANVSGDALFIWFWVGLQVVSFVLGDLWRAFNPYVTLADGAAWLRARMADTEMSAPDAGSASLWPATAAIFGFVWYELAYHSSASPRSIGVFLTVYSAAILGGAARNGRGWVRSADGFAVLFEKLAAVAPFHRDDAGKLRMRAPLSGLTAVPDIAGTVPFILVVLGSTTFDGFTRSSIWQDIAGTRTGWSLTAVSTLGLIVLIGLVALAYSFAVSAMAGITGEEPAALSNVFGPTLIPIAAAYSIAHYFSLLVLEGQRMFIHISDPFGKGWDLFGTKDYAIDWTVVSTDLIAWVQTGAIAAGHVLAVAAAHDLAISRYEPRTAVKSQYPMLMVMIGYTVVGLLLLLGA